MNYKVSKNEGMEIEASGSAPFFRLFRKIAKSGYLFRHLCLSVRMDQLGVRWTDFHEITYLNIFKNLSRNSSFIKM
jgi:hypothetical protein